MSSRTAPWLSDLWASVLSLIPWYLPLSSSYQLTNYYPTHSQIERLTVRENLLLFGQIKGLDEEALVSVCEAFMTTLNIKRYENKLIQQLSGGNRRKVSLAVALLGAPPTVYLDEVSLALSPSALL
jgi:ATP-binding cassette, subfamily A (ABC1), member 3